MAKESKDSHVLVSLTFSVAASVFFTFTSLFSFDLFLRLFFLHVVIFGAFLFLPFFRCLSAELVLVHNTELLH